MSKIEFRTEQKSLSPNYRTIKISVPEFVLKNHEEIQRVRKVWDKVRTRLGQAGFDLGHYRTTLRCLTSECPVPKPDLKMVKDFADMTEKEFSEMLATISDLGELEGVANRRKILNAPHLKRYSQWQRDLIIQRKWEILHG
jgi:hypothetical protein